MGQTYGKVPTVQGFKLRILFLSFVVFFSFSTSVRAANLFLKTAKLCERIASQLILGGPRDARPEIEKLLSEKEYSSFTEAELRKLKDRLSAIYQNLKSKNSRTLFLLNLKSLKDHSFERAVLASLGDEQFDVEAWSDIGNFEAAAAQAAEKLTDRNQISRINILQADLFPDWILKGHEIKSGQIRPIHRRPVTHYIRISANGVISNTSMHGFSNKSSFELWIDEYGYLYEVRLYNGQPSNAQQRQSIQFIKDELIDRREIESRKKLLASFPSPNQPTPFIFPVPLKPIHYTEDEITTNLSANSDSRRAKRAEMKWAEQMYVTFASAIMKSKESEVRHLLFALDEVRVKNTTDPDAYLKFSKRLLRHLPIDFLNRVQALRILTETDFQERGFEQNDVAKVHEIYVLVDANGFISFADWEMTLNPPAGYNVYKLTIGKNLKHQIWGFDAVDISEQFGNSQGHTPENDQAVTNFAAFLSRELQLADH